MANCTWMDCHVSGIFDSVPCSPVGPFKKVAHRADCSLPPSPMPLFGIRSRSQKQSDRPQDSGSASSSSSRPPLLPQTNLALSTPEDTCSSSSSSFSDDLDVSPSKHPFRSKKNYSEPDEPKSEVQSTRSLAPPPRTIQKLTYANYSNMYMQNHLNTFSFGAPSSDSSSVHPIDPLSQPRDDQETDLVPIPDTTPRPSVVMTPHPRHQSQRPSQTKPSKSAGQIPHERDSDTASSHTFGTCSVSSSSRPSGSHTNSGYSNTTSDNDLSSDEELCGRHPLPAEFSSPDISPRSKHLDQDASSMYASEEEYNDYHDDYDHDPETGIEIESMAYPGSDRCTIDYRNVSRECVPFDYAEKRGSLALPITASSDRSYLETRIRENSVATLRRPSRSMDELHSINFAQEMASSSFSPYMERSLPPSPTSVPGSEGDWRDLRKKSIQRDKDLPSISSRMTSNQHSSELNDFDPFWMHHRVNGVVGFDLSDINDIVGEGSTGRSSNDPLRKESGISAFRRPSTASSSNVDIMYRRVIGPWATQKDRDQRGMWTFVKEHDRLPPEDIRTRQNHIEKERPSISSFFSSNSRPSSSAAQEHGVTSSGISFFDGRDKEKAAGKEKALKEIWRGMPLDSEEFWNNQATGRFRVYRRNTPYPEAGKPLQQRLNITFIRTPYVVNPITRDVLDGPAVTIHRHSKAGAFSISRHFRAKSDMGSSSRRQFSSRDPSDGTRKKSNMILLGTRKVQKAYTSTTTTRKLESHGLLDGRPSPRDEERMKREYEHGGWARTKAKDQDKAKDKGKDKKEEKKKSVSAPKKITNKEEMMSKKREQGVPDGSGGSSAGSAIAISSDGGILVNSSTSVTTPDPSEGSGSFGSIEQSVISHETTSSERTVLQTTSLYSQRRRRHPDDYHSSDDEGHRYMTRTPHRETYAVLPPEIFEHAHHQEHPSHGLFGWGKSKGVNQIGHRPNPYEASYNPPWPVTTPRINSETRKGIVDDLNMSFQDVGLLPALGEIRSSQSQVRRKREQQVHASRRQDPQSDIFEGIPSDALCMLLPLWPGETDPASARKYPSGHPLLPPNSRQYLLVYYKVQPGTVPPHGESKTKSDKKWSRGSPTSSHEASIKREERGILLNNFYIIARIVSHRDLQGTGIRVPDVGLAVSGPLDIAYGNMPTDVPYGEYILGVCNSRDAGIDFLQDGLEKMGLSRNMPNPNPVITNDDDDSHSLNSVAVLTPLGRAVMEMAWLGGLALTSFNPAG